MLENNEDHQACISWLAIGFGDSQLTAMKSAVATGSDEFKLNRARYLERIADLQKRRMDANQGGSAWPIAAARTHRGAD
jgi:hypothetical protein